MTALLFQAPEPVVAPAVTRSPEQTFPSVEEIKPEPKKTSGKKKGKATTEKAQEPKEPEPPRQDRQDKPDKQDKRDKPDDASGDHEGSGKKRRRGGRGKRGKGKSSEAVAHDAGREASEVVEEGSSHRRRHRRRSGGAEGGSDEVQGVTGSTRLEAKRMRRRDGRETGRRRTVITESQFLARRESVDRVMIVREQAGRTQIAVLEDQVLVEHYVSRQTQGTMAGNVYLGRVQNVLPSMEAAFIDIGKGRNAVLYAGEVNWDVVGVEGEPRRIEQAMKPGDAILVQVTKDPLGHKGARLTSQLTLAGRFLVLIPRGGMTGISRKLPEGERNRLKRILSEITPEGTGVIVRTAAEGASEEELKADISRLTDRWAQIEKKAKTAHAPALLKGEPDVAIRVVRDIFNGDFSRLVISGSGAWGQLSQYVEEVAPDLMGRLERWSDAKDVFAAHRIDEQLSKGMDRKVWLPSGGSIVIDRTEAMTVIDVNTGKFTGAGSTLEETVTRNNLEAAEEIVRQLRLRDVGGIIVIDFIDMVLESNRDLVLRRLIECLGRDRTRHQVAEVTSLGLVQMTRKRVGQGLVEAFSEPCEVCLGRGVVIHTDPGEAALAKEPESKKAKRARKAKGDASSSAKVVIPVIEEARPEVKATLASIAAAASHQHEEEIASKAAKKKKAAKAAEPPVIAPPPEPAPTPMDDGEPAPEIKASPRRRVRRAAAPAGEPAHVPEPAHAPEPAPEPDPEPTPSPAPRKRVRRAATAPAGPPPSSS